MMCRCWFDVVESVLFKFYGFDSNIEAYSAKLQTTFILEGMHYSIPWSTFLGDVRCNLTMWRKTTS